MMWAGCPTNFTRGIYITHDSHSLESLHLRGSLRGLVMQEMDLLLYGDSILESLLGNQVGQPRADWADIADLWTKHHGGSKAKVLAISGVITKLATTPMYSAACVQHCTLPAKNTVGA